MSGLVSLCKNQCSVWVFQAWSKHQKRLFRTSAVTWPQTNPSPFGTGHEMVWGSQNVSALPGTPCPWCGIPLSNHQAKSHRFKSQFPIGRSPIIPRRLCFLWWYTATSPWPRESPQAFNAGKDQSSSKMIPTLSCKLHPHFPNSSVPSSLSNSCWVSVPAQQSSVWKEELHKKVLTLGNSYWRNRQHKEQPGQTQTTSPRTWLRLVIEGFRLAP